MAEATYVYTPQEKSSGWILPSVKMAKGHLNTCHLHWLLRRASKSVVGPTFLTGQKMILHGRVLSTKAMQKILSVFNSLFVFKCMSCVMKLQ